MANVSRNAFLYFVVTLFVLLIALEFYTDLKQLPAVPGYSYEKNATAVSTERRLCSRDDIRYGSWVQVNRSRPIYIPSNKRRCPNDGIKGPNDPHLTYEWQLSNDECIFPPFDHTRFCRQLRNRTMAMIGDSLMTEMFHSLLNQLGGEFDKEFVVKAHGKSNEAKLRVCHNTATVQIIGHTLIDSNRTKLSIFLKEHEPHVILMNTGAHYVEDEELKAKIETTIGVLLEYQRTHPAVRIFWKTTTPGHPNCWDYKEPVHDRVAMTTLIHNRSLYNFHPIAKRFRWWLFEQQNELVLDLFAKSDLNVEIIDGYDLLLPRPDAHKGRAFRVVDCLHHCHPGPFDLFARIYSHYLDMTPQQVMGETFTKDDQ